MTVDTMDAFWSRLGAFADPVDQLADTGCGCSMGAAASDVGTSMDATAAMSQVLARYTALSTQGETLRQMMQTGMKIPCEVWLAYAQARQDYLAKSQAVFDQLAQKDITVEQVVYSQGKPQADPNDPNKVRTVRIQAPLRPPAFVGINEQCPGVPVMYGASLHGAIGWEPMPVSLGALPIAAAATCVAATLGGCLILIGSGTVVLGVAGYLAYKVIKAVVVRAQGYDPSSLGTVTSYTSCFQGLVKSGMTPADAAKQCASLQPAGQSGMPPSSSGLSLWSWLGIGAGVIILGSFMLRFIRGRAPAPAPMQLAPGVGGLGRRPRGRYSKSSDPILLGDLYYQPRGR